MEPMESLMTPSAQEDEKFNLKRTSSARAFPKVKVMHHLRASLRKTTKTDPSLSKEEVPTIPTIPEAIEATNLKKAEESSELSSSSSSSTSSPKVGEKKKRTKQAKLKATQRYMNLPTQTLYPTPKDVDSIIFVEI